MTEANAAAPTAGAPDAAAQAAATAAAAQAAAKPGTEADLLIGDAGSEGGEGKPLTAEPTGPVVIEFNPTGDAGLDMALGFFGKLGLGPGDAAFDAATNGDFGMLKAKLGQLGDKAKGFEGFVALAEQSYEKGKAANAGKVAKDVAAIHQAVGGEEQWKAIQKWASANAEPDEKASVNAALKQGGVAAKAMAQWLASKYAGAKGTTVEPADIVAEGAAGKAASTVTGALSAAAYAVEVQATRAKMGFKFEGSREYAALQARRLAGKKAGL